MGANRAILTPGQEEFLVDYVVEAAKQCVKQKVTSVTQGAVLDVKTSDDHHKIDVEITVRVVGVKVRLTGAPAGGAA